jgi:excisionase family DNA binding protein
MKETILSQTEVARILGVKQQRVNNWILHGEMPYIEIMGTRRVYRHELKKWVEDRRWPVREGAL